MPTLITTDAIVLNRRLWSESSQIVTLVAHDLGKLSVVARGARKITSELGPALEPITESQVVFSRSSRGNLAHVRSADIIEYFPGVKRSLVKVALASALCELVDRAMPEDEPNEPLYEHVRTALLGMERAEDRLAVNWLWRAGYELAADLGYGMQFDRCVRCGSDEAPHPRFSLNEGGPVCRNCTAEFTRLWLPETQLALLRLRTALIEEAHRDELFTRRITKPVNRDLRDLFEAYFRYHIPNFERLKSLDILTSLLPPAPEDRGSAEIK